MRPSKRAPDELRRVTLERGVSKHAEGSCLVCFGDTHVLCTASLAEQVPGWLRGGGKGWVTAEYGMLPRATHERMRREATLGSQGGRTQEIQRLIGRSLRAVTDLKALGEKQITIDCDVLQADGGTRTAAITGAWVALHDAIAWMRARNMIGDRVLGDHVAAVSCGMVEKKSRASAPRTGRRQHVLVGRHLPGDDARADDGTAHEAHRRTEVDVAVTRPPERRASASGSAVVWRTAAWSGVRPGLASSRTATAPATWGEAMLVPEASRCRRAGTAR